MRAEARRGEPLDLVGGYGEAFGLWVVTSIQETASHFLAGGAPLRQGFRLTLKTYGADTSADTIGEGGK